MTERQKSQKEKRTFSLEKKGHKIERKKKVNPLIASE